MFSTQEQFTERVNREARSEARNLLGLDPEEAKKRLARLAELEAAQQEAERQQMSELERVRADAAAATARAEQAEAERDEMRFSSHVSGIAARLGIRNVEYAAFVAKSAAEALPEGQQLDVEAHFTKLLEQPAYKGAFGVESPPIVEGVPATTTPAAGATGAPPPPPPPGATGAKKDAMAMSPEEFRTHLATIGSS